MKKITLLLLVLGSIQVMAQNKKQDILYLKNGGMIYGTIKDKTDKVKIQISGGSTMIYKADEIDSIGQESMNKTLRKEFFQNYHRKDKGYRNITELQFSYGPKPAYYYGFEGGYTSGDDVAVSIHTINGYQVCPQFFIGVGVGMDRLLTFRETFIPLYIRFQTELLKKRITPYLFGDIGYGFKVADRLDNTSYYKYYNRNGGLYMTLGAGVHIYTKGPLSYMLGIGYRRHYNETKYGYPSYDSSYKQTYQRLVVSWGLTF